MPETYKFSWHEDYSAWRIEELKKEIEKANNLLKKYNFIEEKKNISNIFELDELSKKIRYIYREKAVNDADARLALEISDKFKIEILSSEYDNQSEFEYLIEHIKDEITNWSKNYNITFLDSETKKLIIDPSEYFRESLYHSNGNGRDNWKVTIEDNYIDLPDNETLYGYNLSDSMLKVYEIYDYALSSDEDKIKVLKYILKENDLKSLLELSNILLDSHQLDYVTIEEFEKIMHISKNNSDIKENLVRVIGKDTVLNLSELLEIIEKI